MKYEFREEDAYSFGRHVGIETVAHGGELFFRTCPYCRPQPTKGNVRTFSINLQTGQFKCFRDGCGVKGNMVTLSRDFDFSLGSEIDEYYRPKRKFRHLRTPKENIIPKEPAVEYLESRGISRKITQRYEITVCNNNDNILAFPFYDERGKMQFVKYRKTNYDPDTDSNKEWCEKNCRPILFGMKQCTDRFDRLIITEGQIDSLSVAMAGFENVVSVPTGSKGFTWVPYCWDWVQRFGEIIVFGDFEKGHISLLEDIQKRFTVMIRHVREEDYLGCKDANEILQKYGAGQIRKCIKNAVFVPIRRVLPLAEVKSVNIYELPKLKTGIRKLDQTLYGGIPFGTVCIVAGKRGDGKSTFTSQIMANAIEQGYSTFAYSGELPNYLYKSWFDFQIAGRNHIIENRSPSGNINRFITNRNQELISSWYHDRAYIYDSSIIDGDEQEDLLKTVTQAVMQYGIRVVLIDNLMTAMYIDETQGTDKFERQGRFVRELTKIAIRHDVLVLLVAHRRKNSFSQDANEEISGSGDITNLAGVTLSYDRGSREDIEKGFMLPEQRKLVIAKNRLFGKVDTEGFVLDYDEKSKRIYGVGDDLDYQFGWDDSDGFMEINEESPFQ